MRKFLKWSLIGFLTISLTVLGADYWVKSNAAIKIYSNVKDIPNNKVGLVLGTSKYNRNGYLNYYYKYRIDAAIALYKAGKVTSFIVSGDNSRKEYDEPTQMRDDLMAAGVPEDAIYLDYAGFRTLDSIVRALKIFGQKEFTIISQKFHNERAIFLGESYGLKVIAYNAKDVSMRYGFKTHIREKLARVKMLLDLTFGVKPKFLGDPIVIK
ncbi:MAG: YdcF family protein [Flavobacteriales bacterium]|jgi:SanA protein|nr:YdcF family protein [Flavobacteriales bacterium]